jgi:7-cyano-7-deazaguanine synthase
MTTSADQAGSRAPTRAPTRAIVLLSGGLDSTTALAWALAQGWTCTALSVDYGQRQRVELERAAAVAARLGVPRRQVALDLRAIGGSALTDDALAVPKDRDEGRMAADVPVTYVPARNTILLALALGLAEVTGADRLVIGANAIDYSGYPDCRPEFLRAFEALAGLATKAGTEAGVRFRIEAPLLSLTKEGIVKLAVALKAPLELTWSCYDPQPGPSGWRVCSRCDACRLRAKGFTEAGVHDPS